MTDIADQEILDLADKIRKERDSKLEEEKRILESVRIKKKIGKYYTDLDHRVSWDGTALNVYRILPNNNGWGEAKVERYYYYHDGHYGISVSTYSEGIHGVSPEYDKEIDANTFWNEVELVLDRIGIVRGLKCQ